MATQEAEVLLALHDGAHFIEKPNVIMALTEFKSLGPAALVVPLSGPVRLFVTPAWDAKRAAESSPDLQITGVEDITDALIAFLRSFNMATKRVASAGLSAMPRRVEERLSATLGGKPRVLDETVFGIVRSKTPDQISKARAATRIAELGFQCLLRTARPGMSEDELAVTLRHYMKTLGAEDNFLMLCAGPHNLAVQPSSGRRLAAGDIILAEITPSYRGQLAQICRTAVLGEATESLRRGYELVNRSMFRGITAARPGGSVSDICRAIDAELGAAGYGEYCRPPHIRRRGHGLGFGSNWPGDVSANNAVVLEPDMFFVIHPNQYLPQTGYLLSGEPVLITQAAAEILSEKTAALEEIPI